LPLSGVYLEAVARSWWVNQARACGELRVRQGGVAMCPSRPSGLGREYPLCVGALWFEGRELRDFLAELVGSKLGLAVDDGQLERCFAGNDVFSSWLGKQIGPLRVRSEELEDIGRLVLAHFGDPDARRQVEHPLVTMRVLASFDGYPHAMEVLEWVIKRLDVKKMSDGNRIQVNSLLADVYKRWGRPGCDVAVALFRELNAQLFTSPWTSVRRIEYESRIALRDLFMSEELPKPVQEFFDQRFIDYLEVNNEDLVSMHWRQFEGLIAEAMARAGLDIEIGPGRNDDGVDIRAWDANHLDGDAALLLVQCKRERTKVGKVIVKALAADIAFEGAKAGLVATTSEWSRGARETVQARSYPLAEVNNQRVREWLTLMRTPGQGQWLL
jgi:restriction system protein